MTSGEQFYILMDKEFVFCNNGERITFDDIEGFEGLPFYVHHYLPSRGKHGYAVTCPRTGMRLGRIGTHDGAIRRAKDTLRQRGRASYDLAVAKQNKEFGTPPAVPGKDK